MNDMRKLIDIVENIDNSKKINEAGFIGRLANKGLAKLGNKKAEGRTDKDALSKRLSDNYYRWLGRTNKEGTLADIQEFLQQVNFTNEQINQITKPVVGIIEQNPEAAEKQNESIITELSAKDFILNKSEINNIMDNASAYAFDKGLYGNNTNQNNNQNNNNNNNNNNNTNQKQPTNDNGTRGSGSLTRVNLFTKPVLNILTDLGVSDKDIKNIIGDSQLEKFGNLDPEGKEKLAAIGYAILRYNKTGFQQ